MDTIFALSSGAPPAGIGVVRISGLRAGDALKELFGRLPVPRKAAFGPLVSPDGTVLDETLVLWFPGPGTVTGEDLAELHLHGGRAVIAAVQKALGDIKGLRAAEPGEFTRRGFANGRIDLSEAEGLADLLSAETEIQRQSAITMAGGEFSQKVSHWRDRILLFSAQVEAVLDFDDEDDVSSLPESFYNDLASLRSEMEEWLTLPHAETLREGFRVALAGPPNAGKSTLFNALIESDAAIIAAIAGTTRDVLLRSVAFSGIPFTFVDMAGLRIDASDEIETIGINRAREEITRADLVLWLGAEGEGPDGAWEIDAQCDRQDRIGKESAHMRLSAVTGEGMAELKQALIAEAGKVMPKPGQSVLNNRQRQLLRQAVEALNLADENRDPLLLGESCRLARLAFDRLIGRTSTEDVLDTLFGRFCIGK
ncbi:tRNA uridine-5-carboxymethylaminomethyl(34) synthesis GTPase MnmE [Altericroceibacterium spongiae]|uniref:tRNA modification GTPase MnmE n=1 Tax=Altericroceibacterium spongiae TaxID=2320269 RepID=A0A420EEE0_9SPHN|nr:tRNA uridine-5-carboxymethylaminomethyl(34) synthesis GTPase MnmE [Altericroceibacterium spongiae]RKF19055.1 tRNA uridine-5-carboxymethylaminomethyl(34) synthesis GTPase MnmE [Altericroceibacterium spongiae]